MGAYSDDKEGNPVGQPLTYEERVELAQKTVVEANIKTPLLVDEIDNPVWCTYGPAPNIAYLIGTDGKIIAKQDWYDPKLMEQEIISYFEEPIINNPAPSISTGDAPVISHTIEEHDDCLICHSGNGIKPFPGDHSGRTKDACTNCHKQS